MQKRSLFISIATALTVACMASSAGAEEIRISVAKTAYENIFSKIKDGFEKETGIKLVFVAPKKSESVAYFMELIEGRADAAVASHTFDLWVSAMKQYGHTVPADITHRVIGNDTMLIITNKDAGVSKLTMDQLEQVFTGKAKSWKQVGGSDVPVSVVLYKTKLAKNMNVRKLIMKEQEFTSQTKEVAGEEEAIVSAVAATKGSIGFLSLEVALDKVQILETPPIGRPITMVSRGAPSPGLQKLITYIRDKGKR